MPVLTLVCRGTNRATVRTKPFEGVVPGRSSTRFTKGLTVRKQEGGECVDSAKCHQQVMSLTLKQFVCKLRSGFAMFK